MFFITIIILSLITLFALIRLETQKDSNSIGFKLIAAGCFIVSWGVIIMALTAMIERWQLALNTPLAHQTGLPIWGQWVQAGLEQLVFLFPVRRVTLGLIYALPILLIPLTRLLLKLDHLTQGLRKPMGIGGLSLPKPASTRSACLSPIPSPIPAILLTAAGLNWLFFWSYLLIDLGTRHVPLVIPVQGGIMMGAYLLLLSALLLQMPNRAALKCEQ